jgi:hypothetical protein
MTSKRSRRTPEEMIQDLEARIAQVKARAEHRKLQRDPTLRHINAALRAIDKALAEASDSAIRSALGEARATLVACLSLASGAPKGSPDVLIPQARPASRVERGAVLQYLRDHPGSRSEAIAQALATDTRSLRPVLQRLRSEGQARAEGQGRATRYFVQA